MSKKSSIRKKTRSFISLVLFFFSVCVYASESTAANRGVFFSTDTFPRPEGRRPKVAVVLAGGGARGIAHIRVLKAIEDAGVPVDLVGGTSMGAIVGGFYAAGYTPAEIEAIVCSVDWRLLFFGSGDLKLMTYREKMNAYRYPLKSFFDKDGFYNSGGLLSGKNILRFFDALTSAYPKEMDFADLPCPFFCVATDIESGERVVLDKGSLSEAIRASMSFPGVFSPCKKDGRILVDGGVVDNLPVRLAKDYGADIVIAVNLTAEDDVFTDVDRSVLDSAVKSLLVMMAQNGRAQVPFADLLIDVDVGTMQITDFDKAEELLKVGEEALSADNNWENLQKIGAFFAQYENDFPFVPGIQAPARRDGSRHEFPFADGDGGSARPSWIVSDIRFEGDVSERDVAAAAEITEWVRGKRLTPADCLRIYADLDASGRFGGSRVFRAQGENGDELLVRLSPKDVPGNEVRFAFSSSLEYSSIMRADFDVVPSVVFRGVTTERSEFSVDVELIDAPGAALCFYQPFLNIFSVSAFYSVKNDYVMRMSTSSIAMQYRTVGSGGGLAFMIEPGAGCFFSVGAMFEAVSVYDTEIEGSGKTRSLVAFARAGVSALDHNILPERGGELYSSLTASLFNFSDTNNFMVLKGSGSFWIPIGGAFSVGALFEAGTDFNFGTSFQFDGAAPVHYQPELSFRGLFPLCMYEQEQRGSFTAGAGLELKYNLTAGDSGLYQRLPVYIIVSGAVGLASAQPDEIKMGSEVLHWNASAGLGTRLKDSFGVVLKGGVHHSIHGELFPFFSVGIGACFENSFQPIDLY